MAKTDEVPVYYRDQDTFTLQCDTWLRSKCREQKGITGRFIDNGAKFRLFADRPRVYIGADELLASNSFDTNGTISLSEVLANVGMSLQNRPIPSRARIRDVQAKIRLYPEITDERSPLAQGRWYASETIAVSVVQ